MDTFIVHRARSAREAEALLARESGAVLIAGGTDIIVKMKDGKVRPAATVAIDQAEDLKHIRLLDGFLWVGAGCTHAQIVKSRTARDWAPLLVEACRTVGSPQIRNRGTIGGNIVTASPAGDSIAAVVALDALLAVEGLEEGTREIPATEFFRGPGSTALRPGEILLGLKIPAYSPGDACAFRKLGQRRAMSIAIASVAVQLHLENGEITRARVALGSVAPTVVRAQALESELVGMRPTPERIRSAAPLAMESACPITDIRGSREYRLEMTSALAYQALYRAIWPPEPAEDGMLQAAAPEARDTEGGRGPVHAGRECCEGHGDTCQRAECEPECDRGVITVQVKLYGALAVNAPGGCLSIRLPAGARLADLYRELPSMDKSYLVALVNQRREFEDRVLAEGDVVQLMNPVGGGS